MQKLFFLNSDEELFKNGAGKLLFYELLTLVPRRCKVAISTTIHDWCRSGPGDVMGVVDIMITSLPQNRECGPRVVGEVKGKGTLWSGMWQTITAMEVLKRKYGRWPVGMFYPRDARQVHNKHSNINQDNTFF